MYLKKVRMENFKSFGKEMEIPLEPGYTNITGPNGSGKSNIGDAILFVLGPKSSKEIRAGRLTDLIFNGGKEGEPADKCRVSLIFENEERTIPIDEDEVTFTRKVKRSDNQQGYNSYFYVNGRSSTLTEFQDLLAHARISPEGYNIVQQGDIARIVEMSDVDRRRILDDISGISEYDGKIEEAEEKKEEVMDDLDRISIMLDEIKTQVEELEDDRKKALKYQELSDKSSEAKEMKDWKTIQNMKKDISSVEQDIEDNKKDIENYKEKKKELEDEIEDISREIKQLEEKLNDKGGKKSKALREDINELTLDIGRAEDRKESAEQVIEKNKEKRKRLKDELKEEKDELSDINKTITEKSQEKEEKGDELEELKEEIDDIEDKQSDSDERIKELRKEGVKVKKKLDKKTDKLKSKKLERDRKEDKIERLMEDISDIEEEIESLEFEKKDAKWDLDQIKEANEEHSDKLEELQDEFHSEKRKEKRLREDKKDLEERVDRLTRKYNQLKAEEKAAKSVKKGYNRAVSTILEARDKGSLEGVHGTIAELAEVEDKYETALKVAAGGRMQSIVVENDKVASRAIKHLKKKEAGRATFLPLNKMRSGRPRGKALRVVKKDSAVDFAIELVDYDDDYENVFWYVFGDTVVMKDIDSAREQMGGVRMVTLDGEKIEKSGAMKGGTLRKNMIGFSAPDRGKLDRVSKELQQSRDNLKQVENELSTVEDNVQELQDQIQELQNQGSQQEQKELESRIERLDKKIEKKQEVLDGREEKKEDLKEELGKIEDSIEYLEEKVDELKKKRKEIDKDINEISPEELTKRLRKKKDREVELTKKMNKLESELDKKNNRKEYLEEQIDEIKEERKELKEEIDEKRSTIKKKESKIKEKKEERKELKKEQDQMDDELDELRNEIDDKKEEKRKKNTAIDQLDTKIESAREYIITLKQKQKSKQESMEELKEELDDDIDFSDEEVPPMKELNNTIRRCENKMEELQPVNMRALEDYKKKKERKEKLQEEYTDLQNNKEELEKLIDEMDKKKKEGLMEVKGEINENFKKVYEELSDGGEAHLELEDQEKPFEGGLVVKARPPGKKVHRIDALSGGEKSLVSMAFIFAIQKYDPSPFYLLDEIDQNLDGVNAENVADMISRNSQSAQFLQVSLRKVTLKKSDHIIGVTIHENGISDVIMKVNIPDEKKKDIPELSEVSKLKPEVD